MMIAKAKGVKMPGFDFTGLYVLIGLLLATPVAVYLVSMWFSKNRKLLAAKIAIPLFVYIITALVFLTPDLSEKLLRKYLSGFKQIHQVIPFLYYTGGMLIVYSIWAMLDINRDEIKKNKQTGQLTSSSNTNP